MVDTWSPCVSGAEYTILIDWNGDGVVTGVGDNVTPDVLGDGSWTSAYGRDQGRQLSPSRIGNAAWTLCNADRVYSPENPDSPLADELGPARETFFDVGFQGVDYPLFRGRIDDFNVHPDRSDRTADFTALDGMAQLQNTELSTPVFEGIRTGSIITAILDTIGWPADRRSIDVGASFARFWWVDGGDAFTAVQEIVQAEGPPAIAYVAPDGTFVFEDRHHRLQDARSLTPQAAFAARRVACDTPAVTGFSYTAPFEYETGWRDIVNSVEETVEERQTDGVVSPVWETTTPFTISSGQTVSISVTTNEPMTGAIAPELNVDYFHTGPGTVTATLSRTSGQTITINLTAATGASTVTFFQLRARLIPVSRMIRISASDTGSISAFGEKRFPGEIPWATANDVAAVADVILSHYAQRRPIVKMRVVAQDPDHLEQMLTRTISDRITIRNGELGLDDDFFIEQVSHTIRRIDPERPPIHATVLGCERRRVAPVENPFTFDKVGAGFDQGEFGGTAVDDPDTIFIFDHATQGQFDTGVFAT